MFSAPITAGRAPRPESWSPWCPGFLSNHPAFAPLRAVSEGLEDLSDWPSLSHYNSLLRTRRVASSTGAPLCASPHIPRRSRRRARASREITELYDSRICLKGELPTRERSWHDLFNVLVWAAFARSKASLNARQHRCHLARLGPSFTSLPSARSREQDTLSMLDEGSVLLLCSERDHEALREVLFHGHPEDLSACVLRGQALPFLFGHALFEHLVSQPGELHAMPVLLGSPTLPKDLELQRSLADALFSEALEDPTEFTAPRGLRGVPFRSLFASLP